MNNFHTAVWFQITYNNNNLYIYKRQLYVCMSGGTYENNTINVKVNIYAHSLSPDLPFCFENSEDLMFILENSLN